MLTLQNITYKHPNRDILFENLNFSIGQHEKVALLGDNGAGKSTLLKIISKILIPENGQLHLDGQVYYVPQVFGQFNHLSIAQALNIDNKLIALRKILHGDLAKKNLDLLNEDWDIENRCIEAMERWHLDKLNLHQNMGTLSGGEKTRVFLAGISIHEPDIILLDEPTNHLDNEGRQELYTYVSRCNQTMVVVSHDRTLLNLMEKTCELSNGALTHYGGNYDFYRKQKEIEDYALFHRLKNKKKEIRKAEEKEKKTIERKRKLDARGKKKQKKEGVARMVLNTLKNSAEKSTSKIKDVHTEKLTKLSTQLQAIKQELPGIDQMKFGFDHSKLHKGKILFKGEQINFSYGNKLVWKDDLTVQIISGERIALKGPNGSGKTTLIKLILGELNVLRGNVYKTPLNSVYIDQDYSLINDNLNVYEQAQVFNTSGLMEHEVKIRLSRFLFQREDWLKPCDKLSGGEKMRLMICCMNISRMEPDIIVLDEPTNNLDIKNIEILSSAVNDYRGTLIVISHDDYFLREVNVFKEIYLGLSGN